MKSLKFITVIILLFTLILVIPLKAQTTKKSVITQQTQTLHIAHSATVISTESVYSDWFTLDKNIGDSILCYYGKSATSTLDKPHETTIVQGSFDQTNFTTVATIGATGDSTETYQTGNVIFGTNYFPYYRLKHTGVGTNPTDAIVRIDLYFINKNK